MMLVAPALTVVLSEARSPCNVDVAVCKPVIEAPCADTVVWRVETLPCRVVTDDCSVLIEPPCVDTVVLSVDTVVVSEDSAVACTEMVERAEPGE